MIYHIDFNEMLATAMTGVRRASAFMILGLRGIDQPIPDVLRIDKSMIGFFPEPIPDSDKPLICEEYRTWIVGAALRELEQSYSIFLDKMYQSCIVARNGAKYLEESLRTANKFTKRNFREKLSQLKAEFDLDSDLLTFAEGFVHARNALAHATGRVQSHQTNAQGKLVLGWLGNDIEIVGASTGQVEAVFRDCVVMADPITDPAGAHLRIRRTLRQRIFVVDELIDLTPHDLHEICQNFCFDSERFVQQGSALVVACGVAMSKPSA